MTLISGFIVGQSITPFYVYQMYSQSLKKQKLYSSFAIEVNGKNFNIYKLDKERRDLIYYNFNRYVNLKENNGHDKYYYKLKEIDKNGLLPNYIYNRILTINLKDNHKHKEWLFSLLSYGFKERIKNIKIYRVNFFFNGRNDVQKVNKVETDNFLYD